MQLFVCAHLCRPPSCATSSRTVWSQADPVKPFHMSKRPDCSSHFRNSFLQLLRGRSAHRRFWLKRTGRAAIPRCLWGKAVVSTVGSLPPPPVDIAVFCLCMGDAACIMESSRPDRIPDLATWYHSCSISRKLHNPVTMLTLSIRRCLDRAMFDFCCSLRAKPVLSAS